MASKSNWPETSKHFFPYYEALAAEFPQLSYGDSCRKAYKRDFGKEYDGEYEGEITAAELNLN